MMGQGYRPFYRPTVSASTLDWLKRPITEILNYVEDGLQSDLEPRAMTFREAARLRALVDLGLGHLELRRVGFDVVG